MGALEGIIAWVDRGDEEPGRAVALLLAAGGARVLVTGERERGLGECVGEIAHGGGKARHFVGTARSEEGARACVVACVDRFGAPGLAFVERTDEGNARRAVSAATRVVALPSGDDPERRAGELVASVLASRASA